MFWFSEAGTVSLWRAQSIPCPGQCRRYADTPAAALLTAAGADDWLRASMPFAFDALLSVSDAGGPVSVEAGSDGHFHDEANFGMILEIAVDGNLVDQINTCRIPPDPR